MYSSLPATAKNGGGMAGPFTVSSPVLAPKALPGMTFQGCNGAKAAWSFDFTYDICGLGGESVFRGKAQHLTQFKSVSVAVDNLNRDAGLCPVGFCIVLSERLQRFHILWRADKKDDVWRTFGLGSKEPQGEARSSLKQSTSQKHISPDEPNVSVWRIVCGSSVAIRSVPHSFHDLTGHMLKVGEVFDVVEEAVGRNGVTFLRLADGRGWVFDSRPDLGVTCAQREACGFAAGDRVASWNSSAKTWSQDGRVTQVSANGITVELNGGHFTKKIPTAFTGTLLRKLSRPELPPCPAVDVQGDTLIHVASPAQEAARWPVLPPERSIVRSASGKGGVAPTGQAEALMLFKLKVQSLGSQMWRITSKLARPALRGEISADLAAGEAGLRFEDCGSMMLRVNATSTEELLISGSDFAAQWLLPGSELDPDFDGPGTAALTSRGFLKYEPRGDQCSWVYEVTADDLDLLPTRSFISPSGHEQPVREGDFLAMPSPKVRATSLDLLPRAALEEHSLHPSTARVLDVFRGRASRVGRRMRHLRAAGRRPVLVFELSAADLREGLPTGAFALPSGVVQPVCPGDFLVLPCADSSAWAEAELPGAQVRAVPPQAMDQYELCEGTAAA